MPCTQYDWAIGFMNTGRILQSAGQEDKRTREQVSKAYCKVRVVVRTMKMDLHCPYPSVGVGRGCNESIGP